MFRFFIQPQLNIATNSIIGYEMLLKEHTPDGWRVPTSFDSITPQNWTELFVASTKLLSLKIHSVSVNLDRRQLMNDDIAKSVIDAQERMRPMRVVVELTERVGKVPFTNAELIPQIQQFTNRGMDFSLDDVDSGDNHYNNIKDLLPYADEIKFALQNFKQGLMSPNIRQELDTWLGITHQYNQRLVLEGIEDEVGDDIANEMGINIRQGYYYGKPHLLALGQDKSFA
ncbi:MAG: EAL domain-containing protein [Furfurilactobacillus sp.]|uniref:EAL domain-containing protein n=1 Tax=Furfurilactobacillus rossiae TaxID=231049 RepID=A0A7C9N800_9LACO|nr:MULTISPECIES: EAL domain-containing protein [Furfurilactobacillus]MCF6166197.1 EAL domain-containing protein [Furfurilactobacillus rossiae]MCF6418228.1 EAL domain-containing protein [Furfurilactobacillus milii]MCH4011750.1 EAL domain-containing protein [Furfurilactobacillus sp.]MCH4037642.1 EAL domain-containing protein [Furfurilactobacillus sp.]MCH4115722.1 EAL domain-containing protein [Furfurilactobacillus sp.]